MKFVSFVLLTGALACAPIAAMADCDQKCERQLASYEKAVIKVEEKDCNLEGNKISRLKMTCPKAIDQLDRRYGRYDDTFKALPEVEAVKARHDQLPALMDQVEELAALEKVISPYERTIKTAEDRRSRFDQLYNQS